MVQRQVCQYLGGLGAGGGERQLGEAVGHKQYAVDQHTVCRALDLKVSEEGVGPEQVQHLVYDVVVCGWVRWAPELGSERQ